ncbi:MAG: TonB-dependent receptor plug domain-containing protein [Gemmatimonadetes bacterium]|nr:TonB-dependent receptor plug domain-containing protein [Gemmatimonadota bacterium]
MRYNIVRIMTVTLLCTPMAAQAQGYSDFCPEGDPDREAVVVGYVTDPGPPATVIPLAEVAASWVQDGTRQRRMGEANMDGVYAVCGLPMSTEVSLRAVFGDRRGHAVPYTTAANMAQQDLELSLTGDPAEEDERVIETGSLAKGTGNAYNSDLIREEDLVNLPEMSVYELLRQHTRLRFDRFSGVGEVILLDGVVSTSLNNGRFTSVQVFVNDRREADGVSAIRGMSIDEIRRIEILSAGEASARRGGDGWVGAIEIITKR